MTFREFADTERLKIKRDEDGSQIIPGKVGLLWDYGERRLAVTLLDLTPTKWGFRRNACLRAGMELHQDGEDEGTLLFDPAQPAQVGAAIKAAQVKRRRVPSPAQLEVLAQGRESQKALRRGTYSDSNGQTVGQTTPRLGGPPEGRKRAA